MFLPGLIWLLSWRGFTSNTNALFKQCVIHKIFLFSLGWLSSVLNGNSGYWGVLRRLSCQEDRKHKISDRAMFPKEFNQVMMNDVRGVLRNRKNP